ncbi:MAG: metallophosphoesterase [Pseudomonadota bacterium]
MNWFSRLKLRPNTGFDAPIAPKGPFFAVGDIHGSLEKFRKILIAIEQRDIAAPIVFVGDYIDRGDRSADVLLGLMELDEAPRVTCLKGNHEVMLLEFLEDPQTQYRFWIQNGGLQTLWSYGLRSIDPDASPEDIDEIAEGLNSAMGQKTLDWLNSLPTMWNSGNVYVTHAGADPARKMTEQYEDVLLWGHRAFGRQEREDGIWVLHGHTIVDQPICADGRISIDTGAYASGRLTGAYVSQGNVEFFEV